MHEDRDHSILYGELARWPSEADIAEILRDAGLSICVGKYSIRVEDRSHFVFQEYGGDLWMPCIDADAPSVERIMHDAQRVSAALAHAGLKHRFEIYDSEGNLVSYLHHDWPLD